MPLLHSQLIPKYHCMSAESTFPLVHNTQPVARAARIPRIGPYLSRSTMPLFPNADGKDHPLRIPCQFADATLHPVWHKQTAIQTLPFPVQDGRRIKNIVAADPIQPSTGLHFVATIFFI